MEIKKLRKQKHLSAQALADLTGLHRRTIQSIELRDDCLVSSAIKIADALGVTLDDLCRSRGEGENS